MNRKTNELIKSVEKFHNGFLDYLNANAFELIQENFNPSNEEMVTFSLREPIMLTMRKNRAHCSGSFDFCMISRITCYTWIKTIWLMTETPEPKLWEQLCDLPATEAMEVYNAIVNVIKNK